MSILIDDNGNKIVIGKPINIQALKVSGICGIGLIVCLGIGYALGLKQQTVKQCCVPLSNEPNLKLPSGNIENLEQTDRNK